MSRVRVHEIARALDKSNKDIINVLKQNGVEVQSHMSTLNDTDVDLLRKLYTPKETPAASQNTVRTNGQSGNRTSQSDTNAVRRNNQSNGNRPAQGNRTNGQSTGSQNAQSRQTAAGGNGTQNSQGNVQGQNIQTGTAGSSNGVNRNPRNGSRPNNGPVGNRNGQERTNTQSNGTVNRTAGNDHGGNRTSDRTTSGTNRSNSGNSNYSSNSNSGNGNTNSTGNNRTYNNTNSNTNRTYSNTNNNNRSNNSNGNTGNANRPNGNGNTTSTNRPYNNGNTSNSGNTNRPYNNSNTSNSGNTNRPYNTSNSGNTNRPNNNSNTNNNRPNNSNTNGNNRPNNNANGSANNNRPNNNNNNNRNNNNNNRNNSNNNYRNNRNNNNRNARPQQPAPKAEPVIKTIVLPEVMTIKELGDKMKTPAAQIVKKLFLAGIMANVNQEIEYEQAAEIAMEYNFVAELEEKIDIVEELLREEEESEEGKVERPPVICVMGHVDHGKTSLLDAIRSSNVTGGEAGGITQHIGASVVKCNGKTITFLDTPGHEAFTSMRMRGAQATDIAILVVAADDGVMPQTIEAINHAKAAGIEIIVAVNKIDKESANVERVKQELMEYELVSEDWGGSTVFVPVSARTREGIDDLLEMILLTAEVLELKANPKRNARGIVIEAQLDKGRGPVATILVQKGTLRVGDSVFVGNAHGKVRAMTDDRGRRVKEAGPSTPVEIIGLNDVPFAGEVFIETDNEKEARSMAEQFIAYGREKLLQDTKARLSLDDLFDQIQAGNVKELNLVVKADVQGSVEAVKQSLVKLSNEEVVIKVIHGGVGAINESDVILASASNAIIIGFNVRPDNTAKSVAERENVDLRLYKIIYNAIEDVEAAMKGMLDPIFEEKIIGHAEVRQTYKASGIGTIAGSYVLDGMIKRGCKVRITREGKLIFEGELASVKRFKDDVKEVKTGYECGLVFSNFNEIQELDIVEAYVMEEVPR